MDYRLGLTSEQILTKKFAADTRGYDAQQVDEFLDCVLEEFRRYEAFVNNELPALLKAGDQCDQLKNRNQELEIELAVLKDKFAGLSKNDTVTINQNNLELHRRISALEKALYKLGQDPNKVK
jgi:DivIVA domain-containing protein